jgi:hypothetical protein
MSAGFSNFRLASLQLMPTITLTNAEARLASRLLKRSRNQIRRILNFIDYVVQNTNCIQHQHSTIREIANRVRGIWKVLNEVQRALNTAEAEQV